MTESNPRSNLVETFIDSEFWRDTVGAELYAAILDQLKLAEQVEELRRENAELSETIQSLEHFAKANECHYGHYSEWVGAIAERDWEKARADKAEERIQSLELKFDQKTRVG